MARNLVAAAVAALVSLSAPNPELIENNEWISFAGKAHAAEQLVQRRKSRLEFEVSLGALKAEYDKGVARFGFGFPGLNASIGTDHLLKVVIGSKDNPIYSATEPWKSGLAGSITGSAALDIKTIIRRHDEKVLMLYMDANDGDLDGIINSRFFKDGKIDDRFLRYYNRNPKPVDTMVKKWILPKLFEIVKERGREKLIRDYLTEVVGVPEDKQRNVNPDEFSESDLKRFMFAVYKAKSGKKEIVSKSRRGTELSDVVSLPQSSVSRAVFTKDDQIYLVDFHRREVVRITEDRYKNSEAALSHSGNKVIFNSNRSGKKMFYLMDINSGNIAKLANYEVLCPDWSKDDKKIAFRFNGDVNLMYLDKIKPIKKIGKDPKEVGLCQTFTADDKRVAYFVEEGNRVVNVDGTNDHSLENLRLFTDGRKMEGFSYLDWSVNNKMMAVHIKTPYKGKGKAEWGLAVMDSLGSNQKYVYREVLSVNPNHFEFSPSPKWSTDGQLIFFGSNAHGRPKYLAINPDTGETINLKTFEWTGADRPLTEVGLESILPRPGEKIDQTPQEAVSYWFAAMKKGDLDTYLRFDYKLGNKVSKLSREKRETHMEKLKDYLKGAKIKIGNAITKRGTLPDYIMVKNLSPWNFGKNNVRIASVPARVTLENGGKGNSIYLLFYTGNNWAIYDSKRAK